MLVLVYTNLVAHGERIKTRSLKMNEQDVKQFLMSRYGFSKDAMLVHRHTGSLAHIDERVDDIMYDLKVNKWPCTPKAIKMNVVDTYGERVLIELDEEDEYHED